MQRLGECSSREYRNDLSTLRVRLKVRVGEAATHFSGGGNRLAWDRGKEIPIGRKRIAENENGEKSKPERSVPTRNVIGVRTNVMSGTELKDDST